MKQTIIILISALLFQGCAKDFTHTITRSSACNDGDGCTEGLQLTDADTSVCIHVLIVQDDNDACTHHVCVSYDDTTALHFVLPVNPDDGNSCTRDTCISGHNIYTAIPNCTPLCSDDFDDCTYDDSTRCHIARTCNDSIPCTNDFCIAGTCFNHDVNCDDGDPNTTEWCDNGLCHYSNGSKRMPREIHIWVTINGKSVRLQ